MSKAVVICVRHGGFGLSRKAFLLLREMGQSTAVAEDDPLSGGYVDRAVERDGERFGHDNIRASAESVVKMHERGMMSYLTDIPRDDPKLVQVVRQLGHEANGPHAELKVVEVPDDVKWTVEEYDGREWIAEEHRTWN